MNWGFLGLAFVFLFFAVSVWSSGWDRCPDCGGQLEPYSTKFDVCSACGKRVP